MTNMKKFFDWPLWMVLAAKKERGVLHPEFSGPVSKTMSFITKSKENIVSPIVRLFFCCCPPDVAGFVVPVIVRKSVQRIPLSWLRTNVIQPRFKRPSPRFVDGNSSAAVIDEIIVGWAGASIYHVQPRLVFGRSAPPMLSTQASARANKTAGNRFSSSDVLSSAIAQTEPKHFSVGIRAYRLKAKQPTVLLIGQINHFRHCITFATKDSPNKNAGQRAVIPDFGNEPSPTFTPILHLSV